jgi:hypothetical protein
MTTFSQFLSTEGLDTDALLRAARRLPDGAQAGRDRTLSADHVRRAAAGAPLPRLVRGKLVAASNVLLAKRGRPALDVRALFPDVGRRKGARPAK